MDIYQLTMNCSGCDHENKAVIFSENNIVFCQNCNSQIFKAKKFEGVVYVLSHPRFDGVKIGITRGDVYKRAKQLSGTGVPGDFRVCAVFPSHRPNNDEKKIFDKLARYKIAKEHFRLDPIEAIARIKTVLNQREPVILVPDLVKPFEALVEARRQAASRLHAQSAKQSDMFDVEPDQSEERKPAYRVDLFVDTK